MKSKYLILIALVVFSCPVTGRAQSSDDTPQHAEATGYIGIPSIQSLTVTKRGNTFLSFDEVIDYENGKVCESCFNANVKSNVPWMISVRSADKFLTTSGAIGQASTSSIFSIRGNNSASFSPVSYSPVILASGNATTSEKEGVNIPVSIKALPGFNQNSGVYQLDLIFEITAQ